MESSKETTSCTYPKAIVVKTVPLAHTAARRVLPPRPDATAVPPVERVSNRVSMRVNTVRRALQDDTATGETFGTARKERIKTNQDKHRANFVPRAESAARQVSIHLPAQRSAKPVHTASRVPHTAHCARRTDTMTKQTSRNANRVRVKKLPRKKETDNATARRCITSASQKKAKRAMNAQGSPERTAQP